jgi:hypothetical protein
VTCGVPMRCLGTLTALVLIEIAALAVQPARAEPSLSKEVGAAPLVQLAGRKGTRAYMPGESGAPTVPSDADTTAEKDSLEECMAIWDAGTHITKSKWREICKRQLKERAAMHSDTPAQ